MAGLTGRAQTWLSNAEYDEHGLVSGTLNGSTLQLRVNWDGGAVGMYKGTIDENGVITGTTGDKAKPNIQIRWVSTDRSRSTCSPMPKHQTLNRRMPFQRRLSVGSTSLTACCFQAASVLRNQRPGQRNFQLRTRTPTSTPVRTAVLIGLECWIRGKTYKSWPSRMAGRKSNTIIHRRTIQSGCGVNTSPDLGPVDKRRAGYATPLFAPA